MARQDKQRQQRPARLPAWIWILVIPLVSWLALFLLLIAIGVLPLGLLGFTSLAIGTPTPIPEQAIRVLEGHTGSVQGVAFSPDSNNLASVSDETAGRLKLWRVADGSLIYSVEAHEGGASSVAFSPDGKIIATGGQDGAVRLWNAADGAPVRDLLGSVPDVTSVAFSPDGLTLAAGAWGRPWQNRVDTVHVWRVDNGTPLLQLEGNPRVATSVAFSPDGQYLAAGGDEYDKAVPGLYVWHMPDGELVHTKLGTVWTLEFLPGNEGGSTLAVGMNGISFVSVPDGAVIRNIPYQDGASSFVFSPDGRLLVTGSYDNTVRLWRVSDGKELQIWRGHSTYVESVDISPDGKMVASGSLDHTVRLWQVPTGLEK
jgi:WD40 repeat protein